MTLQLKSQLWDSICRYGVDHIGCDISLYQCYFLRERRHTWTYKPKSEAGITMLSIVLLVGFEFPMALRVMKLSSQRGSMFLPEDTARVSKHSYSCPFSLGHPVARDKWARYGLRYAFEKDNSPQLGN